MNLSTLAREDRMLVRDAYRAKRLRGASRHVSRAYAIGLESALFALDRYLKGRSTPIG